LISALEQTVLVPLWLPDSQHESRRLKGWNIGGLVCGVGNHEQDVDDGLGREPRHRRRSNVLDAERALTECGLNALTFTKELLRPLRIGLGQGYRAVEHSRFADGHAFYPILCCLTHYCPHSAIKSFETSVTKRCLMKRSFVRPTPTALPGAFG
jgi:hypothetical protein